MKRSIFVRVQWLKALYLCRAIFHEVVFQGGSLPLFRTYKVNIERKHISSRTAEEGQKNEGSH